MTQIESTTKYQADAIVIGAGLAGLTATIELLEQKKKVLLLERGTRKNLGGLAKNSFGGVLLINTPEQKRSGIKDSEELALEDWLRYGEITEVDWPYKWAKFYSEHSIDMIYEWLKKRGVSFLPVVNWPERGMDVKGNSLPRWHIAWGTGFRIIERTLKSLAEHQNRDFLNLKTEHKVEDFILKNNEIIGVKGSFIKKGKKKDFEALSPITVLACGGVCGGDLSFLKECWDSKKHKVPKNLLNGSHPFADGLLHKQGLHLGARLSNLENHWHYAAGIRHPSTSPDVAHKGLSLVPPRSALWLNAYGERIGGKKPLIGYTDTSYLVDHILEEPGQYSWQVMNWNIAIRELAVSGCQYMTSFLNRNKLLLLKELIFGNKALVEKLLRESKDIVVANSLEELVSKMNNLTKNTPFTVKKDLMINSIRVYDKRLDKGDFSDLQIQKIQESRRYRGDRIRICRSQKIEDKGATPFIAIRERILSRKSLGGFRTNLSCQTLGGDDNPIPGLYAIGEASGFGGGGIHGKRSLEGTFLGGCILTAHQLAQSLKE